MSGIFCLPILVFDLYLYFMFCSVTLLEKYDTSLSAFYRRTKPGVQYFFLSYFVVDLSFYLNILIKLRTKVSTPHGKEIDLCDRLDL